MGFNSASMSTSSLFDIFNSEDFMPHGHCFLWRPDILWLHVLSDAGIALAYFSIPFILIYFVRKRRDLPFQKVFLLFGAFILFCGATHVLSIWVLWHPDYAFEGGVKAMTAIASIATFFVMVKMVPQALHLPSPAQLAKINAELQAANQELAKLYRQSQESGEAHLRAVVDHTLDGIVTINMRGKVESFNPACERIFGYQAAEVIGQNVKMLMPEPYHGEHDDYLAHYAATGEAKIIGTAGREVRARRKDGAEFPMELSVSAFHLEDGAHYSGIMRDISGRKSAEARLLSYMNELERSNQELDDFAYIASHDLKEPLRGLINQSMFLQEDYSDKLGEDGLRRLQRMSYLAQRLDKLVNDLLYFSRLGRTELAIQLTNPNEIVAEVAQMMDTLIKERGVRIVTPKPMPAIVCDKVKVTEVFRNLMTNAVKYNDKADPVVEVGYLDALPHGPRLERHVFYIKDNGVGVPPEHYEDIFRIFKRLQADAPGVESGTGVGLTFVKKIVERHHGAIWVESEVGSGATFFFTLGADAVVSGAAG